MTFYERYIKLRDSFGKSNIMVTEALGLHKSAVTSWKDGAIPRADTACKLADYFNTTVEYLITGKSPVMPVTIKKLAESIESLPTPYQNYILKMIEIYKQNV